jgi:hypothetical protein
MPRRYFIDRYGRETPRVTTAAYIMVERVVLDGSATGSHTSTRIYPYGSPVPLYEAHSNAELRAWIKRQFVAAREPVSA